MAPIEGAAIPCKTGGVCKLKNRKQDEAKAPVKRVDATSCFPLKAVPRGVLEVIALLAGKN
jgi:hypothetical protein